MWANSGQEISLPGLVVSFPDENKRSINTTGKNQKGSFCSLTGKLRSDTASKCKLLLFTLEAETKKYIEMAQYLLHLLFCGISVLLLFCSEILPSDKGFFIQRVASTPYLTGGRGWCAWRGRRAQGCWPTSLGTGDSAQRLWWPWSSCVGSHQRGPKELPVSCPACTSLLQHLPWFAWEAWNWEGWSFGPRQYSHPYFIPEDAQVAL